MVAGFLTTLIVGAICIALGISNMRGNISSLHSYHRARVSEEDRLPFGRLCGLGTIVIGVGFMLMGVCLLLCDLLENEAISLVGTGVMTVGFIVGISLNFYAMKKGCV